MLLQPSLIVDDIPGHIKKLGTNQIVQIADMGRDDPDVAKLWIGEGDLATPSFIVDEAERAMRAGHTRYTYSAGLPLLRQALGDYHRRHWGIDVVSNRIAITAGGMNAIMQAMQALLAYGDEVIYPEPAWPNVAEAVKVVGGVPVSVSFNRTDDGKFVLDLDAIESAITPRTKMIAINSPSNPTGWVMRREQMTLLRDLARAHNLWILSDEVYAHFVYDGEVAPSFLQVCDEQDRLIVTNTFSKNWSMTGWRAGWIIYPAVLEPVFDNLCQFNTTSIPTFIQYAAVTALNEGDGFIREMVGRCTESREILVAGLQKISNVKVFSPEGAFYLMLEAAAPRGAFELAKDVLLRAKVGVAPGTAFGLSGEGLLRICFAVSPELAKTAVHRLERYFSTHT